MQPEQMILPTIATLALGTALLVPLRDDRLGKRATVGGADVPLRPNFAALLGIDKSNVEPATEAVPQREPDHEAEDSVTIHETSAMAVASTPNFRAAIDTLGSHIRRFFSTPDEPARSEESGLEDHESPTPTCDDTPRESNLERSFAETLGDLLPLTPHPVEAPSPVRATPGAQETAEPTNVTVVANLQPAFDRVVPLTRMPLRPQPHEITWPHHTATAHPLLTESDRFGFLEAAARSGDTKHESALLAAYREENARGRMLALRALRAGNYSSNVETYVEALHVGNDEERTFAIDALIAANRRDAVTFAFNDRVDAVAAQAALAYVGTYARADYVAALSPFVDRARIETLLGMLAGIVE